MTTAPTLTTTPAVAATGTTTARTIVHDRYGSADVLELRDYVFEAPTADQVHIRVRATSVNPAQWYGISGPWFARMASGWRRPKDPRVNSDVAGEVVAVGGDVTQFAVGAAVFGTGTGAWGELAVASAQRIGRKPAGLSYTDAAALPIAALTALQALRDTAKVQPGQKVLINGASGGVGPFAVQLAKWLGADVTAVCSTQNVELAHSLGADRVVDYRKDDFCALGIEHDVVLDIAGSRRFRELRRVLTRDGLVVVIGAKMSARGLGPIGHIAGTKLGALGRSQRASFMIAKIVTADLELVGNLVADGTVRVVIDRSYEGLEAIPDALRQLEAGHARGKIVISV